MPLEKARLAIFRKADRIPVRRGALYGKEPGNMPKKGTGKGTYVCAECGAEQTIKKDTDALRQCDCEGN